MRLVSKNGLKEQLSFGQNSKLIDKDRTSLRKKSKSIPLSRRQVIPITLTMPVNTLKLVPRKYKMGFLGYKRDSRVAIHPYKNDR